MAMLHMMPGYKLRIEEDADKVAADSLIAGTDVLIQVNVLSPHNEKGPLWINPRYIISTR